MSFMYLHLRTIEGKIHATVKVHGDLVRQSVGHQNTQFTNGPFAVFQVHEFDGFENLSDKDLIEELFRRFSSMELLQRLQLRLTADDIMAILRDRLKGLDRA